VNDPLQDPLAGVFTGWMLPVGFRFRRFVCFVKRVVRALWICTAWCVRLMFERAILQLGVP
jgi:hypothetical protein